MSYHIRLSNNKKIVDAIKQSGINTEYKPRFEVLIDGKIIGGSTYDLVSNTYLFDIGILEEYQGMGIAKDLMKRIIQDAKELGVEKISTYVVNERFAQYLNSIGFSVYEEEATMYIYVRIDDMKFCVESEKESEGLECDKQFLKNYRKLKLSHYATI